MAESMTKDNSDIFTIFSVLITGSVICNDYGYKLVSELNSAGRLMACSEQQTTSQSV